jgi:hypothetical protein
MSAPPVHIHTGGRRCVNEREREREREKERWKETVSADAIRTVIEALPRHHVIVINVLPQ